MYLVIPVFKKQLPTFIHKKIQFLSEKAPAFQFSDFGKYIIRDITLNTGNFVIEASALISMVYSNERMHDVSFESLPLLPLIKDARDATIVLISEITPEHIACFLSRQKCKSIVTPLSTLCRFFRVRSTIAPPKKIGNKERDKDYYSKLDEYFNASCTFSWNKKVVQ